ncbi:MAG: AI-2E family transporter [Patescibacteria group bacterium]
MKYNELENSTKIILKIILAGLLLAFLWVVRDIILILLLSLILASALDPLVGYFNEKRVPRFVSVLTVYVLVLGMAGAVIYLLIPPAIEQFTVFRDNVPAYSMALQERFGSTVFANLNLSEYAKNLFAGSGGASFVVQTFGIFSGLLAFISVLVISFYLVAEEKGMKQFISALLPDKHHEFTMGLLEKIQKKMGLWILGQVILSVAIFLFTWIGLSILGIKYALFLALLAGLLEVVPYIGPFLSAVPGVLFAFIQSPPLAIAVAILYLLIQKIEGYVLVPKIMEKTVGTSPLVVLVALLVGFKLAGVVGLLIAVPLVSAFTVVVNEFWSSKTIAEP